MKNSTIFLFILPILIFIAGCNQIQSQKDTASLPDTSEVYSKMGIKGLGEVGIPPFACSDNTECIIVDSTQPYLNEADYFKCGCPTCERQNGEMQIALVDYSKDDYIAVNKT